jgi:hypothetical protein
MRGSPLSRFEKPGQSWRQHHHEHVTLSLDAPPSFTHRSHPTVTFAKLAAQLADVRPVPVHTDTLPCLRTKTSTVNLQKYGTGHESHQSTYVAIVAGVATDAGTTELSHVRPQPSRRFTSSVSGAAELDSSASGLVEGVVVKAVGAGAGVDVGANEVHWKQRSYSQLTVAVWLKSYALLWSSHTDVTLLYSNPRQSGCAKHADSQSKRVGVDTT